MTEETLKQLKELSDKALLVAVKIRTAKTKAQLAAIGPDMNALNMTALELLRTNQEHYINTMSDEIVTSEQEDK